MFKTRITELLGIEYPVIQGAMQWLSRAELAAAVSNAGGLGIISGGSFESADELRQEIRKMKSLTEKPFAVNITLLPTRRPIVWEEYIKAALEEGVKIIETSGRSPEPYMEWLKSAGVKTMHKIARIKDAKAAEHIGADAVTIIGFEAGGHPGMEDVGSLVLVPKAVDSLKIPIIAGGGFCDGRGLVAALALGAEAVLMATRFMACKECPMHPNFKELLLRTQEKDTIMIERSIGMAARVIKTDFSAKVLDMEKRGATLSELLPLLDGLRGKRSYESGETDDSIIYCGQAVGLINDIPSAKEIIESIIAEARLIGQRLRNLGTCI